MATILAKSGDNRIECFYDSNFDKSTFVLFLPVNSNIAAIRINKYEISDLIDTLKDFDEKMRFAGAIK